MRSSSFQHFWFDDFRFLNCGAGTARLDFMANSYDPEPLDSSRLWSNRKVLGYIWKGCEWAARASPLSVVRTPMWSTVAEVLRWQAIKVLMTHVWPDWQSGLWCLFEWFTVWGGVVRASLSSCRFCSISGVTRAQFTPSRLSWPGADESNYNNDSKPAWLIFRSVSHTWVGRVDAARGLDWSYSETPSNRVRLHNHPPMNVGGCHTYAMLMVSYTVEWTIGVWRVKSSIQCEKAFNINLINISLCECLLYLNPEALISR